MTEQKAQPEEWKFDENGKVTNRALAEMIVSSLFYAKPRVVAESDHDRAIDIVEEELNVVDAQGKTWRVSQKEPQ